MFSFQALQVFIFLIPGFIASIILNALVVRKEKSEFSKVVEALVFALLIYTASACFSRSFPLTQLELSGNAETRETESAEKVSDGLPTRTRTLIEYDRKGLALLFIFSCTFPIAVAVFINRDWHMKLARKCGITSKTASDSVWQDVFRDKTGYVVLEFEDRRRLYGWPEFYSDTPQEGFIFLKDAAWIDAEGKCLEQDSQGILVTPSSKIRFINFAPFLEKKENSS